MKEGSLPDHNEAEMEDSLDPLDGFWTMRLELLLKSLEDGEEYLSSLMVFGVLNVE